MGVSVGIERVFAVLEGKFRAQAEQSSASIRETRTQVSLLHGRHCRWAWLKTRQVETQTECSSLGLYETKTHTFLPTFGVDDCPPLCFQMNGMHAVSELAECDGCFFDALNDS